MEDEGLCLERRVMQETKFFDRRIFERIPVKLPLKFLELTSNKESLASTHDISAKGISLVTDEKLLPHTSLEMWLQIPNRGNRLYTRGRVVWSEKFGFNQYRIGISLEKAELMGMSIILRNMYPNKI